MNKKILRTLQRTVFILMVLFILTFLSGFLKGTQFEHISIILFFLFCAGGAKIIVITSKTRVKWYLKFFLFGTGISTILFVLLISIALLIAIPPGLTLSDTLESLEGLFYLTSVLFLIGLVGSMLSLRKAGH